MHKSRVEAASWALERGVSPGAIALCTLVLTAICFRDSLAALMLRWNEPGGANSHGYLVAAAVPVLVWWRRSRLAFTKAGRAPAAVALAALLLLHVFARAAHVDLAAWVTLPLLALAACMTALGTSSARALAAPVACFYFAIPLWFVLTPPLQWLTVHATHVLLAAGSVSAFVQGDFVTVSGGTFEIAGGCSGTSYFVVALATAALVGVAQDLPWRRRLRLTLAASAAAILANWVRVASIIAIGDATAMQSPLIADHAQLGWWLFAIALAPVVRYAGRPATGEAMASSELPSGRPLATPQDAVWVLAAFAALCAAPAWLATLDNAAAGRNQPAPALPTRLGARFIGLPAPDWTPRYPGAVARDASYGVGATAVDVSVRAYSRQQPGRKLVGEQSSVVGDGWTSRGSRLLRHAESGDVLRELEIVDPSGNARVVWSWYEVRGRRFVRPWQVKAWEGLAAFVGPGTSGVVATSTRCSDGNCDAARARLAIAYADGLRQISADGRGR